MDRMIRLELDSLRIKFDIRNVIKGKSKRVKSFRKRKGFVPRGVYHKSPDELLKLLVNRNIITHIRPTHIS